MQWWRVFLDKLTGKRSTPNASGPRRRKSERFAHTARLRCQCESWPRFEELLTGNVSAGGLFVPTNEHAAVGEAIDVELEAPDGSTAIVHGRVVNIVDAASAATRGTEAGLGIELESPPGPGAEAFDSLLATAQSQQPELPASPITPTGSVRLSAVQAAVSELESAPAVPVGPVAKAHQQATKLSPIVGIDLGTTYTSVAAVQGKKVSLCAWADGEKSSPSVIAFPDAHTIVVGAAAKERLASDPLHTVLSPKRLLGRAFDDPEIQGFLGSAPYRTLAAPDGSVAIELHGNQYVITQLISYILREARAVAESTLGTTVTQCVMTCPVSFDAARTQMLRRAGSLAGLEVVALIDEPSAAALANRFDPGFGGVVGVYDFGGGTFDFSVVDVSRGDFAVLATAGDTWLGGDDFDIMLAEAAANQFWHSHKVDLRKQALEWQRLLFACEAAKRKLTWLEGAEILVPDALRTAEGMVDLEMTLARESFEKACRPIIAQSLATCMQALELLDMRPDELSAIYLSGGTTYIRAVRDQLAEHFGVPIKTGVPPEHAVCLGAAIHAAQLQARMANTTLEARDD